MKPYELARCPSRIKALLEEKILLMEEAQKRLDGAILTKESLFGHIPGDVADEILMRFFGWDDTQDTFHKTQDIINRKRVKELKKGDPESLRASWEKEDKRTYELYWQFINLANELSDKAWKSRVLVPSVLTGLIARLRRERGSKHWLLQGDLEIDLLSQKVGMNMPQDNFHEKEGEGIKERTERWREWSSVRRQTFWHELACGLRGPHHVVGLGSNFCRAGKLDRRHEYDWVIENEGKAHKIRMVVPWNKRLKAEIRLMSKGRQEWIVGRMIFLNSMLLEWQQTPKGPRIDLGAAKYLPQSGIFRMFDFQSDKVLDLARKP